MSRKRLSPALDWFRLLAAFLVVCNHTSPLDSFAPGADFWLTRVLARVAVPFFFRWPSPSSSWSAGIFSPKEIGRTRGNF